MFLLRIPHGNSTVTSTRSTFSGLPDTPIMGTLSMRTRPSSFLMPGDDYPLLKPREGVDKRFRHGQPRRGKDR
jgi:hypothetical protein